MSASIVRCNDLECCSPWRSWLQHLLPGRFLPNPVPLEHNGQGIVVSNVDHAHNFLPLFVNLQLNSNIHQENMADFIIPPYDLYCPPVLPHLCKRCCSVCGIYHASIKSALSHTKACHPKTAPPAVIMKIQPVEKRRPMRIAARRQREMMVILRDHLNGETAEWLDVDDIETDHDNVQQQQSATSVAVNIISNIQEWTDTPWEDM